MPYSAARFEPAFRRLASLAAGPRDPNLLERLMFPLIDVTDTELKGCPDLLVNEEQCQKSLRRTWLSAFRQSEAIMLGGIGQGISPLLGS